MSFEERMRDFPLLANMTREETAQIASFLVDRELAADEIIIDEKHPSTSLFFILKGRVKIFRILTGTSSFLTILEENDMFGEVAFVDQQARSASAVTCEPTKLAELSLDHFEIISKQNPVLGIHFMQVLSRELSRKFRAVNEGLDLKSADQAINELIATGQQVKISTDSGTDYFCSIKYADKSASFPMLKIDLKGQIILLPFGQIRSITLANRFGKF
jgi:CRP-like cAMP-binding protein